jgi:hypothetical protein
MKNYQPKYWNEKGRYQDLHKSLQEALVPREGEADTEHGEILRIASNLYYDIFNNGGCNFDVMRDDRINLFKLVPMGAKKITQQFIKSPPKGWGENGQYMQFLDLYINWVVTYVASCVEFEKL